MDAHDDDGLIRDDDVEPTPLERTIVLDETLEMAHLIDQETAARRMSGNEQNDYNPIFPDDSFNDLV